ncbi:MAG: RHS repeat domain-containing protein, partial [Bacillota bacterium]
MDLFSIYKPAQNNGNSLALTYNLDSQLTSLQRADGRTVSYNYNTTTGLLENLNTAESTVNMSYQYGHLIFLSEANSGTSTYTWVGRLLGSKMHTGGFNFSLQNTYNLGTSRLASKVIAGQSLSFGYDQDGYLSSVGSLQIQRDSGTPAIVGTIHGGVQQSIAYNIFGEATSRTYTYGGSTVYAESYTRDKLGRITQNTVQTSAGSNTYGYIYNIAGRLAQVNLNGTVTSQYSYDEQGNRTSSTRNSEVLSGTYDSQDRILTYGNNQYGLSADGEVTSILNTSNGQARTFTYSSQGQLTAAKLTDGTQISYTINGENRRFAKSVNGVIQKYFEYDEGGRLVADANQNGTLNSVYVYATQGHSPDYMIRSGVEYSFLKDQLGSIVMVVNKSTGEIVQQISYDEFGRVLSDTSPGFTPFGFAGGIYDSDTKLVQFGVREYDAETGRWISKDPILFSGADTNLYGYVA